MKAYDAKDYLGAKKNLEIARDSGLSFGFLGLGTRKMRNALADVNDTLARLQTAYKSGKSAYDAGDFETAQKDLTSVTQSGISLGKDTDADIKTMLGGIGSKVTAQRAAKAQQQNAAAAQKAEQAKMLIEEANALLAAQNTVQAKVAAADKAMAANDLAAARKNLTDAQDILKDPKVAGTKPMAAIPGQISTKLAAVDKAEAAQKRMAEAKDQLAKMVKDADALTKTDVLAAEQKAVDAAQFAQTQKLTLTSQQAMALDGVKLAVDQKYGVQRQLRRTEYGKLDQMGKMYADAGQYGAAAQLYSMLADGDATMVTKMAKDMAAAKAADAQHMADQQKQKAADLVAAFDKARQTLKDAGLDAGLKARQDIIRQAKDAKLNTDQAVIAVNEADLAFLNKDVIQALADAAKNLAGASDKQLADARDKVKAAQQMAAKAPAPGQSSQPASLDLAQKLHTAVVNGDAAQVGALKQQMADVSLTTESQKAAAALNQGDYDGAKKILDAAPVADASQSVKQSAYEPVRGQLDASMAAQQQLNAIDDALAAHDFAKAAQTMQQLQGVKLPALLDARLSALGAVLNAARNAQSKLDTLAALNEQGIAAVRQTLAARKDRQVAWTAYVDALKALFGANAEDAAKALAAAADKPGLTPAESQNVSELEAGLASAGSAVQAETEQMLTRAEDLCAAGDTMGAAQGLANVKASSAYENGAAVKQRADALDKKIQVKEQQAQTLYAQAVTAYKAGDTQEVRRLMGELKANYSKTQAYQDRQ